MLLQRKKGKFICTGHFFPMAWPFLEKRGGTGAGIRFYFPCLVASPLGMTHHKTSSSAIREGAYPRGMCDYTQKAETLPFGEFDRLCVRPLKHVAATHDSKLPMERLGASLCCPYTSESDAVIAVCVYIYIYIFNSF